MPHQVKLNYLTPSFRACSKKTGTSISSMSEMVVEALLHLGVDEDVDVSPCRLADHRLSRSIRSVD